LSPAEAASFVDAETKKYTAVAKEAGVSIE
jgi:hypothetical protein